MTWKSWWTAVCALLLMLSVNACSLSDMTFGLLGSDEESSDQSNSGDSDFEAGMEHFQQQRYDEARQSFRRISPKAELYPKALSMIQRIPFEKGMQAYRQKNYTEAIHQFNQVPKSNSNHQKAMSLLAESRFALSMDNYEKATTPIQRLSALSELADSAKSSGQPNLVNQTADILTEEITPAWNDSNLMVLIQQLEDTTLANPDESVINNTMQKLHNSVKVFSQNPEVRQRLFSLIVRYKRTLSQN